MKNFSFFKIRGSAEHICPKFTPLEETAPKVKTESERNSKVFDYHSLEAEAPAEESPETQSDVHTVSAFDKIRRELSLLGMKPEILFVRHKELQEQEDETADYDTDTEGDNEE